MKIDIRINKSKIYFTPLFNEVVPISYFKSLKNTYFWYDSYQKETFCLLYKFDGRVKGGLYNRKGFTVYENDVLFNHELFSGYRDFGPFVLYEFQLTDELLEFRNQLLEGRYSMLDDAIKAKIVEFNTRMYGVTDAEYIKRILNRDEELIEKLADDLNVRPDMIPEASSAIKPERELFANFVEESEEREIELK